MTIFANIIHKTSLTEGNRRQHLRAQGYSILKQFFLTTEEPVVLKRQHAPESLEGLSPIAGPHPQTSDPAGLGA